MPSGAELVSGVLDREASNSWRSFNRLTVTLIKELIAILRADREEVVRAARLIYKEGTEAAIDPGQMARLRNQLSSRRGRLTSELSKAVAGAVARAGEIGVSSGINQEAELAKVVNPVVDRQGGEKLDDQKYDEKTHAGLRETVQRHVLEVAGFESGDQLLEEADPDKVPRAATIAKTAPGVKLSERVWKNAGTVYDRVLEESRRAAALGLSADKFAEQLLGDEDYWGRVPKALMERTPIQGKGIYQSAFMNSIRVARTEMIRAHHQALLKTHGEKRWVAGFKWNLSGAHKKRDICDDLAAGHSEGMPEGVYTVDEFPDIPHPHCTCYQTIYADPTVLLGDRGWDALDETVDDRASRLGRENKPELINRVKDKLGDVKHLAQVKKSDLVDVLAGVKTEAEFRTIVATAKKRANAAVRRTVASKTGARKRARYLQREQEILDDHSLVGKRFDMTKLAAASAALGKAAGKSADAQAQLAATLKQLRARSLDRLVGAKKPDLVTIAASLGIATKGKKNSELIADIQEHIEEATSL